MTFLLMPRYFRWGYQWWPRECRDLYPMKKGLMAHRTFCTAQIAFVLGGFRIWFHLAQGYAWRHL